MQQSALRFPQSLDYCSLRREDGDRTKEYGLLRKAKTAFSSCGNGIVLLRTEATTCVRCTLIIAEGLIYNVRGVLVLKSPGRFESKIQQIYE